MKKSVIIVEDDHGLRTQLVEILESAPDIKCLGAYMSAELALDLIDVVEDLRPMLESILGDHVVLEIRRDDAVGRRDAGQRAGSPAEPRSGG